MGKHISVKSTNYEDNEAVSSYLSLFYVLGPHTPSPITQTANTFFYIKIYLQDVNTYTSVPGSIKLFLVNQFTCRTLAVRGVTVLPRQVMTAGTAVKWPTL
jgi:hypothetical protein